MRVLVINSGSSSIKYKLFDMPKEYLVSKGLIEHIGEKGSKIRNHYTGLEDILRRINHVAVVGHRVVHGAERFRKPVLINESVIQKIKQCCSLAPLHNPANLAGILACKSYYPALNRWRCLILRFTRHCPITLVSTGCLINITKDSE